MTELEGASNQMEYLKNVVLNYMLSTDLASRDHMLKAACYFFLAQVPVFNTGTFLFIFGIYVKSNVWSALHVEY
jgi:hypothetical protein